MRIQGIHTLIVMLIAATAAIGGLWYVCPADSDAWLYGYVVGASVFMWLLFGNLYLRSDRAWIFAIYLGFLSPLIGCLLVCPPWSFLFVFGKPIFSIGLGVTTSLAVCAISRRLAQLA